MWGVEIIGKNLLFFVFRLYKDGDNSVCFLYVWRKKKWLHVLFTFFYGVLISRIKWLNSHLSIRGHFIFARNKTLYLISSRTLHMFIRRYLFKRKAHVWPALDSTIGGSYRNTTTLARDKEYRIHPYQVSSKSIERCFRIHSCTSE